MSVLPGSTEASLTENYKQAVDGLESTGQKISFGGFDFKAIIKRDDYDRVNQYLL